MRNLSFISLLALACDPFGHWPVGSLVYLEQDLWDSDIVDVDDGVYVRLPHAGDLVRIDKKGNHKIVDLSGAEPVRIQADLNQERVLVFARWPICDDPDPDIVLIEDCEAEDLDYGHELAVVDKGVRKTVASVPGHLNAVAESPNGQTAVMYLDYDESEDLDLDPVVDLTEVLFVDLDSGDTRSVSVGFSPRNILFTQDGTRAVVLSRSRVVVINLDGFEIDITYHLTQDADHEIDPSGAVLTPDDRYALISIANSTDLYKLDLEVVSIDMEGLDQIPSDMAADLAYNNTVVVYGSSSNVDVITDHDFIERSSIELDEPANSIAMGDGYAVLYHTNNDSVHDVIRLDLETLDTVEYVADNPVDSLQITNRGDYAVGILRPEAGGGNSLDGYQDSRYGLAVIDLLDDDIVSLVLNTEPVGVELVERDEGTYALLLLENLESLIQVDLSEPGAYTTIDLPAPPAGISARPDGTFTIPHTSELGLVSFLNPETGQIETVGGFASPGMLSDTILPRRKTDKE